MNTTNKHPVACLERAAVNLTVKGFFYFPRQKEMRHSEVKRYFLLYYSLFILKTLLLSQYFMFSSLFMSLQMLFDSSWGWAICNHIKSHIWFCLFLWICVVQVWLYLTISVYVSYLQNGLFTLLTIQFLVFILSCTPTDLYSTINCF